MTHEISSMSHFDSIVFWDESIFESIWLKNYLDESIWLKIILDESNFWVKLTHWWVKLTQNYFRWVNLTQNYFRWVKILSQIDSLMSQIDSKLFYMSQFDSKLFWTSQNFESNWLCDESNWLKIYFLESLVESI